MQMGNHHSRGNTIALCSCAVFAAALIISLASHPALAQSNTEGWIPGQYIVKYNADAVAHLQQEISELSSLSNDSIKKLLSSTLESTHTDSLPLIKATIIQSNNSENINADATLDLLELGIIDYITPDHTYEAITTPNDPMFNNLWGMHQSNDFDIDAPEAWDITTGNPNDPIVVGVIDTGVDYEHTDLNANMWTNLSELNGSLGVDDDGNGIIDDIHGYNAINGSGDPMDDQTHSRYNGEFIQTNTFHGTHCAGTIGAVANNGIGVSGVAWNVRIMGLKFLNWYGSGYSSNAIKLIQYAVDMKQRGVNIRVLSNSWGGGGYNQALLDAIQQANANGILFVAAAGNSGRDTDSTIYYPQGYNVANVVSVAAITSSGNLAYFSNYGATTVDLGAPGVSILSTRGGGTNSYHSISGTSMATPHVSGIAAIAFSGDPTLNPASIRQLLINTVKPISTLNGKLVGPGMANLNNVALQTGNHLPTIDPIAKQIFTNEQTQRTVPLSISDQENDPITVTAQVVIPGHRLIAANYDELWNITRYESALDDAIGLNEKHIFTATYKEYIILSDGLIYRPDPTYLWLKSGQVDPLYYIEPELLINAHPTLQSDYGTVSVNEQQNELTISVNPNLTGSFNIEVTANDGKGSSIVSFECEISGNTAPVMENISDQITAWQIPLQIPLYATDTESDEFTFSATFEDSDSITYRLDQQYDFELHPTYQNNKIGHQEKYLRSKKNSATFMVLPNGEFRLYISGIDNSPIIEKIDPWYWENIDWFIDAFPVVSNYPGLITIIDDTMLADGIAGYSGVFRVDVTVEDSAGAYSRKHFWLTLANEAPVIEPINSILVGRDVTSVEIPLNVSDENNDFITLSARILPPDNSGTEISIVNNKLLLVIGTGYIGSFAVEVSATDGNKWSFQTFTVSIENSPPELTPIEDQQVHWNEGSVIVSINASDSDGDSITINASASTLTGQVFPGTLNVSSTTLELTPPVGYVGTAVVSIEASDGVASSSQQFQTTFANNSPTLNPISDLTATKNTPSLSIPLSATDTDNDTLTYSAELMPPADSGTTLNISDNILIATFAPSFLGSFDINVHVTDEAQSDSQIVHITRQNTAPQINSIDNQQAHWKNFPITVSFSASDSDEDTLSISASAHTLSGDKIPDIINISGSTLTAKPKKHYIGTFGVVLEVSDGLTNVIEDFQVSVTNSSPQLAALQNIDINKTVTSLLIPLSASDGDNDEISLSAELTSPADSGTILSIANNILSVTLAEHYLGSFGVQVTASDSIQSDTKTFQVTRENHVPTITPIADQQAHWRNVPINVTLSATDTDGEEITLNAIAKTLSGHDMLGVASIFNDTLTITPPSFYIGSFNVTITASDGVETSSNTFGVTLTNDAPVLTTISSQDVSKSTSSISIPLEANDNNNDTLTFSTNFLPPNNSSATLSIINQNLLIEFSPSFFGSFDIEVSVSDGAQTDSQIVQISRNNALPHLSFIGTQQIHWKNAPLNIPLTASDSDNDTLTFSALATTLSNQEMPGVTSIANSTLTITPSTAYIGSFNVTVTVSDGFEMISETFLVTLSNNAPTLAAIANKYISKDIASLNISLETHDADNDELILSAELIQPDTSGTQLRINNQTLILSFESGYSGTFNVSVTADDGAQSTTRTFSVKRNNFKPELEAIQNRQEHFNNFPLNIPLTVNDPDNDPITFTANAVSAIPLGDNSEHLSAQINDSTLQLQIPVDFLGNFTVTITANDGEASDAIEFTVTVLNNTPILAPIENQAVSKNANSIDIQLNASDADNDPLTFSTELLPPADSDTQLSITDNILTVAFSDNYFGSFDVRVLVSDGRSSDSKNFTITRQNRAPDIKPILDVMAHWKTELITVDIIASDPDNDSIALSASAQTLESLVYELDQAHDFLYAGNYYFNQRGHQEKYFVGDNQTNWYLLYPSGELLRMVTDNLDTAVSISKLNQDYYENPALLFDVSAPSNTFSGTTTIEHSILTITSDGDFVGGLSVTITANDGEISTNAYFSATFFNTPPTLAHIENISVRKAESSVSIPISATDADNDPLTLFVELLPPTNSKATLELIDGNLTVTFANGFLGSVDIEISVTDDADTDSQTFHITRENIVPVLQNISDINVHWKHIPVTLNLVGTDEDQDPLSFSAIATTLAGEVMQDVATLSDATLTILPPTAYIGTFKVTTSVTDGLASDTDDFTISVTNTPPHLATIDPQTIGKTVASLDIPLHTSDATGDELTLSAALPDPTNHNANVSISSNNTLHITFADGYLGTFNVEVTVSDGIASDTQSVNITRKNLTPNIEAINNINTHWRNVPVTIPLSVSDPDGDTVSLTATIKSLSELSFELDQTHNFSPCHNYYYNLRGRNEKYLLGDNDTHWYFIYPNGDLYKWYGTTLDTGIFITRLSQEYHSNPELLFDIVPNDVQEFPGSVTIENSTLTIDTNKGFIGKTIVTVTVTDGTDQSNTQFYVNFTNTIPTIVEINDITINKTDLKLSVPLEAHDADNDPITFSTKLIAGNSDKINLEIVDSHLEIDFYESSSEIFDVEITADDGVQSASQQFTITRQNLPPAMQAIGNYEILWRNLPFTLELFASDPDGDHISFTASVATAHDLVYALDQQHHFYIDTSFYYNKAGRSEKYILGDNGNHFYILYPNGDFYRLKSNNLDNLNLDDSTFIAQLGIEYHADPTRLFNVRPPTQDFPGTVSISGNTLSINAPLSYLGTVLVSVTAWDEKTSDTKSFFLSIINHAPQIAALENIILNQSNAQYTTDIEVTDLDNDSITLSVIIDPASNLAYELDQKHDFFFIRSYYYNARGGQEKYFRGTEGWYLILPNGNLYRWTGNSDPTGIFIAELDSTYYLNPSLLFDVPMPDLGTEPAIANITGSTLTVIPKPNFLGVFYVELTAFDGASSDTERFSITILDDTTGTIIGDEPIDTDGDGVSDVDELEGGTDPFDAGSFIPSLGSPIYTLWNGFLNMMNILELVNPNDFDMDVKLSLYAIDGSLVHVQPVTLPPLKQFDVVLNALPGFSANSYGITKIEFDGILDGRMFYYRNGSTPSDYEYAFGIPLSDPSQGLTAVSFNTFQPSTNHAEARNLVANWLTIVNLSNEAKRYVVKSYDQTGILLLERKLKVEGFGRIDVDGGHSFAGISVVGTHIIEPQDATAPYIAQITRFGGNTDGSSAPTKYSFAFPLVAHAGTGRQLLMPMSRQFDETNWVELINTSTEPVHAYVQLLDKNGNQLYSERTKLKGRSQKHYEVSSFMSVGEIGTVLVSANRSNALIMQSMIYFRDNTGRIEAMYGSQGKEAIGRIMFGSYNRFLAMQNWLKVVNYSNTASKIQLIVNSTTSQTEEIFELPAYGSTVLPIHDGKRYGTIPNSYGTIELRIEKDANLFAELLRLKPSGITIDFAAPTTVR